QHWAARGVSFELKAGEAIALIGPNGAGKSTLLKLITGTIQPNEGGIASFARISSILELGLGFNPEFSGRENVRFAGGLMGLSGKRIEELMPDIEKFSELGHFFDQPLRVYSSGMQARLAFSVATAERPDLLIVDEVLSVGDSYFQHKSFDRIRRYKEEGTALLFVTHNMADVRALCERVLLLEKGQVLKDGPADEVTDFYNARVAQREAEAMSVLQERGKDGWLITKSGSGEARVKKLSLLDAASGQALEVARTGQELILRAEVEVASAIEHLVLGFQLRDRTGHVIWGTNTWHTKQVLHDLPAGREVSFEWRFRCILGLGSYSVSPALTSSDTHLVNNYEWTDNALVFDVTNNDFPYFIGTTLLDGAFTIGQSGS
ncbi:MAG TPA: ABC transporter ATP-binding protein, partial [Magnetospirillaceae bacterium]|nr:ABC transporter ATP-binding protein [Magnetospirillaceae bacterium]